MPDAAPEGGGPPDPTVEWRLARLETDFKDFRTEMREMRVEMRAEFAAFRADMQAEFAAIRRETREDLKRIDAALLRLGNDVSEIKGRITQMPTVWMMITTIIGSQITFAALLAAIVFGVLRLLGRG